MDSFVNYRRWTKSPDSATLSAFRVLPGGDAQAMTDDELQELETGDFQGMAVNIQTMQEQLGSTIPRVPSYESRISSLESSASGPTFSSIPTSSEAAPPSQSQSPHPIGPPMLRHEDASLLQLGVRTAIRNDVEFYRSWTKNEFDRYNKKLKLKFYEYYCASCGAIYKLFIPPKWIGFHCRICDRTEFTKKIDEVSNEFSKAAPARKMMQEYCAGCGNMQRVFGAKMMGMKTKCKVCGRNKFVKRMKELPWMERSLRSR